MKSSNFSNYTLFGLRNEAEKYISAGYILFVFLCSVLGDSIVLIASVKFKAFKIHKIVVAFIQHLSVCDLMLAVGCILPSLIQNIGDNGNGWILGPTLCYISSYTGTMLFATGPVLIAAMTTAKLLLVKFPLRSGTWSTRQAHLVGGGIWLYSLSGPICVMIIDKDDVFFDYRLYQCLVDYSTEEWKIMRPILGLMIIIAPNIAIIINSILLLVEAKKVAGGAGCPLKWQGIVTVVLTAGTYTVSLLPITLIYSLVDELDPHYTTLYKMGSYFTLINVLANFFIYSLTVKSFRIFLKAQIRQVLPGFARIAQGAQLPCYKIK